MAASWIISPEESRNAPATPKARRGGRIRCARRMSDQASIAAPLGPRTWAAGAARVCKKQKAKENAASVASASHPRGRDGLRRFSTIDCPKPILTRQVKGSDAHSHRVQKSRVKDS